MQTKKNEKAEKPLHQMTPQEQTDLASQRLAHIYTQKEIEEFLPLIYKINELKKKKNAIILGHNYMKPEVLHGVSDYIGDSFGLAKQAEKSQADIILFNGVYFMAESAKILNPDKKVLIADTQAGCSLADGIKPEQVRELKVQHPGVPVVTYINSSAAVKAESDIICTSSNALKVVESLKQPRVLFIPDRYLAANISQQTGVEIIPFQGDCEVHREFTAQDIHEVRRRFPEIKVLAHPECSTDVTQKADFTGSTSAMIQWVNDHPEQKQLMLVTECSMGDNIRAETGDREFLGTCRLCPHMKLITLPKILDALTHESNEVFVDETIRQKAYTSLKRMLEIK